MAEDVRTVLGDQGPGVVGALVVSVELLDTMEMWWHGWQLPTEWLVACAVVGLAGAACPRRHTNGRLPFPPGDPTVARGSRRWST